MVAASDASHDTARRDANAVALVWLALGTDSADSPAASALAPWTHAELAAVSGSGNHSHDASDDGARAIDNYVRILSDGRAL